MTLKEKNRSSAPDVNVNMKAETQQSSRFV
jgi:hypothetical protein